jgi:hypothetical protein
MSAEIKSVWLAVSVGALSLLVSSSLAAQSRAGGVSHPAGVARTVHVVPIRPGSRVGTPLNPNFAPIGTVPGLSFNVQALAAADRRNPRRGGRDRVATPFLWYSPDYAPYLDYGYGEEQPQPPYDYAQPQNAGPPGKPAEAAPPTESAYEDLQPPPPDVGQFVLVRLDGQVIFASAFMAVNGRVTYVTREGIRRSFPVSELDKDATRELNEANGTSISLAN